MPVEGGELLLRDRLDLGVLLLDFLLGEPPIVVAALFGLGKIKLAGVEITGRRCPNWT